MFFNFVNMLISINFTKFKIIKYQKGVYFLFTVKEIFPSKKSNGQQLP